MISSDKYSTVSKVYVNNICSIEFFKLFYLCYDSMHRLKLKTCSICFNYFKSAIKYKNHPAFYYNIRLYLMLCKYGKNVNDNFFKIMYAQYFHSSKYNSPKKIFMFYYHTMGIIIYV